MFTGIVETTGRILSLKPDQDNLHLTLSAAFSHALKIDQSVAHNGVCLTVVQSDAEQYVVTAIRETLQKTNLGQLREGDLVNLERCMKLGDRLDGHIVQGHVDQTGLCTDVSEEAGSWRFSFEYDPSGGQVVVEKGSICINGVSLTVVDAGDDHFSVAIIPYTFAHTNFSTLKKGDRVNLEFDIVGKYVARLYAAQKKGG